MSLRLIPTVWEISQTLQETPSQVLVGQGEHSHYLLPSDLLASLGGHNFGDLPPHTDHLLLHLLLHLLRYVWNTAQGTDNVETAHCSSLEKMLG